MAPLKASGWWLTQRRRESTTPRKATITDQIDVEHGQQRDNRAATLASREGAGITRKG